MIEEGNQIATDLDPVTMPVTELLSEIFCPPNFPKLTAKQNLTDQNPFQCEITQ